MMQQQGVAGAQWEEVGWQAAAARAAALVGNSKEEDSMRPSLDCSPAGSFRMALDP